MPDSRDREQEQPLVAVFLLCTLVGVNQIVTPPSRLTTSPFYDFLNEWVPLSLFGIAFFLVGMVLLVGFLIDNLTMARYALLLAQYTLLGWSVLLVLGAVFSTASPSGFLWPLFVAYIVRRQRKELHRAR